MRDKKSPQYYIRKLNFLYTQHQGLFRGYFGWTYEDFVAELNIVYVKAVKAWKPARKVQLTTFIISCMKNHITDKCRETMRQKRVPFSSLDDSITGENGMINESSLKRRDDGIEPMVDYDDPESKLIVKQEVMERLALVQGEDRTILNLLINEQATASEIAEHLGQTESYVLKAMSRLEKRLAKGKQNG